jgi:hypothetical protein
MHSATASQRTKITRLFWTHTNFLAAGAILDIYGIVETPDTAGLSDPRDAAVVGTALNEQSRRGTP